MRFRIIALFVIIVLGYSCSTSKRVSSTGAGSVKISEFTKASYPEVGDFLRRHVKEGAPIDYAKYLEKVGVKRTTVKAPEPTVFIRNDTTSYILIDTSSRKVMALLPDNENNFYNALGIQNRDLLLAINDRTIDPGDTVSALIAGYGLEEGKPVKVKVERDGKEIELTGKVRLNYRDAPGYKFADQSKRDLKEAWLKDHR